ncbi:MAG TPA: Uma2 family endonuclease [Gemmataceae bacterium]|jgi:Uma2 family endonuclease
MKAVMPSILPDIQAMRKCTGADRWDEMWEGVLHMPPMPNRDHQDLEFCLESFLRFYWAPTCQGKVYHQINVAAIGGWPDNYRIPDLVLLLPQRFAIDRNEYFEGGPDVVVEIHSPGDEAYEKLPFYRDLGVSEVWIIHRDTRQPEIHVLKRGRYKKQSVTTQGWIRSPGMGIEMAGAKGKLAVRLVGDDSTRQDLPLD